MAMAGYLSLPGIKGSAIQKVHEGKIVVSGVSHDITSDLDPVTGRPSGKVKHKALLVTKDCDQASPPLYQAMEEGKVFDKVTLEFHRVPPDGGMEENHATILLGGVRVASIRLLMDNNRRQENDMIPVYEQIGLAYDAIQWQWHAGGAEGRKMDSDQTPYLNAEFAPPIEVDMRKMAFDFLKSGITGTGAATVKAVKSAK